MSVIDVRDSEELDKIIFSDDGWIIRECGSYGFDLVVCDGGIYIEYSAVNDLIKALKKAEEIWCGRSKP